MLGGLASGRNAVSRCGHLLFLLRSFLPSTSPSHPPSCFRSPSLTPCHCQPALLPCLPNHRVKSLQRLRPPTSSKPDRPTLIDLFISVIVFRLKAIFFPTCNLCIYAAISLLLRFIETFNFIPTICRDLYNLSSKEINDESFSQIINGEIERIFYS